MGWEPWEVQIVTFPGAGYHQLRIADLNAGDAFAVCRAYEERNEMSSRDFYKRYLAGEFTGQAAIRWAIYYEALLDLSAEAASSEDEEVLLVTSR